MGMRRNGKWLHGNGRDWECKNPFLVISAIYVVKYMQRTTRPVCRVKWRHIIYGHDTIAILWVCVELRDEDNYSNKTEWVGWRWCPYDHELTNKAYLSDIAVTIISESFTRNMTAKTSWYRYGTKLRHCLPMHTRSRAPLAQVSVITSITNLSAMHASEQWRHHGVIGSSSHKRPFKLHFITIYEIYAARVCRSITKPAWKLNTTTVRWCTGLNYFWTSYAKLLCNVG